MAATRKEDQPLGLGDAPIEIFDLYLLQHRFGIPCQDQHRTARFLQVLARIKIFRAELDQLFDDELYRPRQYGGQRRTEA